MPGIGALLIEVSSPPTPKQHPTSSCCAGDGIVQLKDWLCKSSVEREVSLVKALLQAPLPARQPLLTGPIPASTPLYRPGLQL